MLKFGTLSTYRNRRELAGGMEVAELDLDRGVGHGAAALVGRQDPVRSNPRTVPEMVEMHNMYPCMVGNFKSYLCNSPWFLPPRRYFFLSNLSNFIYFWNLRLL